MDKVISLSDKSEAKKGYTILPNDVLKELPGKVGATATLVYIYYLSLTNQKNGYAYPSMATTAKALNIGVATVKRANAVLVEHGLMVVDSGGPSGRSNRYRVAHSELGGGPNRARGVAHSELGGSSKRASNNTNTINNQNKSSKEDDEGGSTVIDYDSYTRGTDEPKPKAKGRNHFERFKNKLDRKAFDEFNSLDLCYYFAGRYFEVYKTPYPVVGLNGKDASIMKRYLLDQYGPEKAVEIIDTLFRRVDLFRSPSYPTVGIGMFTVSSMVKRILDVMLTKQEEANTFERVDDEDPEVVKAQKAKRIRGMLRHGLIEEAEAREKLAEIGEAL